MSMPRIRFLSFDGCPLAGTARAKLQRALERCGYASDAFESVDLLAPSTPDHLARWGSPTILVEGRDVTGAAPGDGVGCRVYDTADRVPDVESISEAIRAAVGSATDSAAEGHLKCRRKGSG